MIIPENVLQKQICFQCEKYLSVGPAKVYPNRQVKCGRCSTDGDIGIPSILFDTVMKNMELPCINRYDGCNAHYPIAKMGQHETECIGGVYDCYLCPNFRGIAYDLNLHCKKSHQEETLENREFSIDLTKGSLDRKYFYSDGTQRLFFIRYDFDIDCHRLTLDIIFVGKCYKGETFYSFSFHAIDNELMYQTKKNPCSVMDAKLGNRIKLKFLKSGEKIAVCRFLIYEEPDLIYCQENVPVIDDSFDACFLRCNFKNLKLDNLDELLHPAVYYFKDIAWRVLIKQPLSATDFKRKFGVYLHWFAEARSSVQSCKVSATFSVVTQDFKRKISENYIKRDFAPGQQHGVMLHDWTHIVDKDSGFVQQDNCINIEIKMKIYIVDKKPVKCGHCKNDCIYCVNEDVVF